MSGRLSKAQIEQFNDEGYLYPLDGISRDQAAAYLELLDSYDQALGEEAQLQLKIKAHLAAPWFMQLATEPAILDAVESLIGPDILLFGASVFSKRARDERFVSWHQDAAYYGLSPQKEVTCWVGLTDADESNGCMRVMPKSHLAPDVEHEETYHPLNMLGRGQTIIDADEHQAVSMPVQAGQFSMHHERTWHASLPNPSDRRRVGVAFFYMPAQTQSTIGRRSATLVRGKDRFGHWDPEPLARYDLDPRSMTFLRESWAKYRDPDVPQAAKLGDP